MRICQRCGTDFESGRGGAKYCHPCREQKDKEWGSRLRPERYRSGSTANCSDCGASFATGKGGSTRCPDCREKRKIEHGRRARTERRVPENRKLVCVDCTQEFSSRRSDARRCQACRVLHRAAQAKLYQSDEPRYVPCPRCGGPKSRPAEICWSCHLETNSGEDNPNWKGGTTRTTAGYIAILRPRGASKYTLEHIAVWEDANGPVPKGWDVHHLNGTKDDNRPENLLACSKSKHHSNDGYAPYEARIRELEEQLRALQR